MQDSRPLADLFGTQVTVPHIKSMFRTRTIKPTSPYRAQQTKLPLQRRITGTPCMREYMQRPNKGAVLSEMSASGRRRSAEAASSRWASDQDFEGHRAAITKLYNSKNATLPRIMEIMESQYGFFATYVHF